MMLVLVDLVVALVVVAMDPNGNVYMMIWNPFVDALVAR